jgi:hypothetical protein
MTKSLIIIDMWDKYHDGNTRFQNITEQTVNRLSGLIKRWHGPVVLACYTTFLDKDNPDEWGKPEGSEVFPWKSPNIMLQQSVKGHINSGRNGLISWDTKEVLSFLNRCNTTDMFFAGASYPGCVNDRELGANSQAMAKFNNKIIIDCVINYLSIGYNDYEIIHDAYRHAIKHDLHRIVTSDHL